PLPQPTGDPQAPAVPLDDMLDDGQPKPRAALRTAPPRIDAVETLGDARDMFGRDPLAFVTHAQMHHRPLGRRPDEDRPPFAPVADGIADQILDELQNLAAIADDRRQVRRDVDFDRALFLRR